MDGLPPTYAALAARLLDVKPRAPFVALGVLFGCAFPHSACADNDLHGRIELQDFGGFAPGDSLSAALVGEDQNDFVGNARLTWEPTWGAWSVSVHYVFDADYGSDARLVREESGLLPERPATWFNITNVFESRGEIFAEQGVDRLSVAYTAPDFVIRIGRQALTWGGGLVFRPMDLFDPFSPTATDTEFKPGTDMVYGQWLFGDGSDLQAIIVPRPDVKGAEPSSNASSFALHYRMAIGELSTTYLVARDHGDWTGAFELSGPLRGATWDLEVVPTFERAGPARISSLANISDAVTLLDRNATIFAEYFHNGFGVTGETSFTTLPADLVDRLSRGQLFNTRQNYLAGGLTLEWTPLLTISPTLIGDLDDGSVYALAAANYSLADNLTLVAGAQVPVGRHESEFGGISLTPGNPTLLAPTSQVYVQLRRYF